MLPFMRLPAHTPAYGLAAPGPRAGPPHAAGRGHRLRDLQGRLDPIGRAGGIGAEEVRRRLRGRGARPWALTALLDHAQDPPRAMAAAVDPRYPPTVTRLAVMVGGLAAAGPGGRRLGLGSGPAPGRRGRARRSRGRRAVAAALLAAPAAGAALADPGALRDGSPAPRGAGLRGVARALLGAGPLPAPVQADAFDAVVALRGPGGAGPAPAAGGRGRDAARQALAARAAAGVAACSPGERGVGRRTARFYCSRGALPCGAAPDPHPGVPRAGRWRRASTGPAGVVDVPGTLHRGVLLPKVLVGQASAPVDADGARALGAPAVEAFVPPAARVPGSLAVRVGRAADDLALGLPWALLADATGHLLRRPGATLAHIVRGPARPAFALAPCPCGCSSWWPAARDPRHRRGGGVPGPAEGAWKPPACPSSMPSGSCRRWPSSRRPSSAGIPRSSTGSATAATRGWSCRPTTPARCRRSGWRPLRGPRGHPQRRDGGGRGRERVRGPAPDHGGRAGGGGACAAARQGPGVPALHLAALPGAGGGEPLAAAVSAGRRAAC
ncbi:MAG: hypothetical protein R3F43_28230 [bacterium]